MGLALNLTGNHPADAEKRIDAILEKVGLTDRQDHLPNELSIGQQQRVALARALVKAPTLILADEPTASLDDDAAANAVTLLLTTAQAQGATLVIATHDARVAAALEPVLAPQNRLQMLTLPRRTDSDSSA